MLNIFGVMLFLRISWVVAISGICKMKITTNTNTKAFKKE
jgi:hypothetical protein